MLYRTGDAAGDVELRANGASRLANLVRIGYPARIHSGARCPHGASQCIRQLTQGGKSIGTTHTSSPGNDDACIREIHLFPDPHKG